MAKCNPNNFFQERKDPISLNYGNQIYSSHSLELPNINTINSVENKYNIKKSPQKIDYPRFQNVRVNIDSPNDTCDHNTSSPIVSNDSVLKDSPNEKKDMQIKMYEEGISEMLGNVHESSRFFKKRFSRNAICALEDWLFQNRTNPYPSKTEKEKLSEITGLSSTQINNWFTNNRRKAKSLAKEKVRNKK